MELAKAFEPKNIEKKLYHLWESEGFFKAGKDPKKESYCIVMPPPNVTGVLHMGHALVNVLQDILIRYKRMSGANAFWIPGTDHAGIATQTVVERHLMASTGKPRRNFDRDEFISHIWDWKAKSESKIIDQIKSLGCSCDWSAMRFTMDEGCNKAVRTLFKKMFDEGLIYRGDYLVNWDPVTQTALADDEVEYEERKSSLWYFKYPIKDLNEHLVIATTRPETMLGDTAVAVSPKDRRYSHLIGKSVLLPITHREIPIIADDFVDPEFGTGVVKVTPAHDPNDYQMGLRHNLEFINIMTPDGKINKNGLKFQGMSMENARRALVDRMRDQGLLEKVEAHIHRVGISYRSKAVIEPYLSKQWFVRTKAFAEKLKRCVKDGKVKLLPKTWENTYFHWIDHLRDWCISRQLWWGHRIPIWYHKEDKEKIICYSGEGLPPEIEKEPELWQQDEDVLDTWFSSALWPFSTLGWPEESEALKMFYPNSILVTGHDILFFWVARMLMMGEYALGELPFPETFLHGLIYGKSYWREREEGGIAYISDMERYEYDMGKPVPNDVFCKWEKMSKSKGNIIDPLEIIDQYGCDAMRMALCASSPQSAQIDLDRRRFEEFKNFSNKIWNGARFVFMNLQGDETKDLSALSAEAFSSGLRKKLFTLEDRWILSALNKIIQSVNEKIVSYQFDQAAISAYDFFWKEFCAYYVEINKPFLSGKEGDAAVRENKQKLLVIVLCNAIRLMHPMAPFITEEIFQLLKKRFGGEIVAKEAIDLYSKESIDAINSPACVVAAYPKVLIPEDIDKEVNHTFELMENIVYAIRQIRGEMKLPPSSKSDIYIFGDGPSRKIVEENQNIIKALVKINELVITSEIPIQSFHSTALVEDLKVIIPLPKEMEEQEKNRLLKTKEQLLKNLAKSEAQLNNPDFIDKAPKSLTEKQQHLVQKLKSELAQIEEKLSNFVVPKDTSL